MPTPFWEVASYRYPNPFNQTVECQEAWETLLSFRDHSSYAALKTYWRSGSGPRLLSAHGVESWKAAFEEFGLVYVLRGKDTINLTPGGQQLIEAADAGNISDFARIGLSLLLRYPLRGARRSRNHPLSSSDLLPYWLLYAAMRELDNEVWQEEIKRILCKVMLVGEAQIAVDNIKQVRGQHVHLDTFPKPVANEKGKFYNTINQITVHGSLSYLTFHRETTTNPATGRNDVRFYIPADRLNIVDEALGNNATDSTCDQNSRYIARMPTAPAVLDELAYFTYLGASVPSPPSIHLTDVPTLGEVAVLSESIHYRNLSTPAGMLPLGFIMIVGHISTMCQLSRDQRVIVEHDLNRSYKVTEKQRGENSTIILTLRRALPITNAAAVNRLLEATASKAASDQN